MSAPRGPRGGTVAGRSRPSTLMPPRGRGSTRGAASSSSSADATRGRGRGNAVTTNPKAEGLLHGLQAGNFNKRGDANSSRGANRGTSRSAGPRKSSATRRPAINSLHRGAIYNSRATRSTALKAENFPTYNDFLNAVEAKYTELKAKRATDRTEAIRNGFLADPEKKVTLDQAITPVGTCTDMCPEFERLERMKQSMIDTAEKISYSYWDRDIPAEERMVKRFRRSAAGYDEQLPSDIRTPATLKATLDYLFDEVIGKAESFASVQKYVWDRTRSIRNDFSIQQVTEGKDVALAVECFERIARFHIISLHQLSNPEALVGQEYFDAHQEREQLNNTLLSLMYYYDDNRDRIPFKNEAEFRAYCIIFEIQSQHPDLEDRMQSWPKSLLEDRRVQTAFRLYSAAGSTLDDQGPLKPSTPFSIARGNAGGFWRLLGSNAVSYLMACVGEIYFGQVRYVALQNIWKNAKSSPSTRQGTQEWTVAELTNALAFDSDDQTVEFVEGFDLGFKSTTQGVQYLDFTCQASAVLDKTSVVNKQIFSFSMVEKKRMRRTLTAVANGLTVAQAVREGAVIVEQGTEEQEKTSHQEAAEDSLFVPEADGSFAVPPTPAKPSLMFNPQAPSFTPNSNNSSKSTSQTPITNSIFGQPASSTTSTIFGKPFSPQPSSGSLTTPVTTNSQSHTRTPSPTQSSTPSFTFGQPAKDASSTVFGSSANQSFKAFAHKEASPSKPFFNSSLNSPASISLTPLASEPLLSVPPATPRPSHAEIPKSLPTGSSSVSSFGAASTSSEPAKIDLSGSGHKPPSVADQGQDTSQRQDDSVDKSLFNRIEASQALSNASSNFFGTSKESQPSKVQFDFLQSNSLAPTNSVTSSFHTGGVADDKTGVQGGLQTPDKHLTLPSSLQPSTGIALGTNQGQILQPNPQKPFPNTSTFNQATTSTTITQTLLPSFQQSGQGLESLNPVQAVPGNRDLKHPGNSIRQDGRSAVGESPSKLFEASTKHPESTPSAHVLNIEGRKKNIELQADAIAQKETEVKQQEKEVSHSRAALSDIAQRLQHKADEKESIAGEIRRQQADVARLREESKNQHIANGSHRLPIFKDLRIAIESFTNTANVQKEKVIAYEQSVAEQERKEAALRAEKAILTSQKLDLKALQSGMRSQQLELEQYSQEVQNSENKLKLTGVDIYHAATSSKTLAFESTRNTTLTEQALNNLSHASVTEQYGILQQFVEFASGDLIKEAFETYRQEQVSEKARPFREHILKFKYGKRWHTLWWRRNMLRKGQNSRAKMSALRKSVREEEKHRNEIKAGLESEHDQIMREAKISEAIKRQIRENDEREEREQRKSHRSKIEANGAVAVPDAKRSGIISPTAKKRKSPDIDDTDDADSWKFSSPIRRQAINGRTSHKRTRTLSTSITNGIRSGSRATSTPAKDFKASASPGSSPTSGTNGNVSAVAGVPRWTPQDGWRKNGPDLRKSINRTHTDYFRLKARGIDPETPLIPDTQKTLEARKAHAAQHIQEEESKSFASSLLGKRKDSATTVATTSSTTPESTLALAKENEPSESVKRANALLESFKRINAQIDEATKDLRETNAELIAQQETERQARDSVGSFQNQRDQSSSPYYSSEHSFTPGQTTTVNGFAFTPGRSLNRSETRLRLTGGSGLAYRDPTEFEAEIKQLQKRQKQVLKQHKPLTMDEVDKKYGLGKYAADHTSKGDTTPPEAPSEPDEEEAAAGDDGYAPVVVAESGSVGRKRKRAAVANTPASVATTRRRRKKRRSLDGPYVYESEEEIDDDADEGQPGDSRDERLREANEELQDLQHSNERFGTDYTDVNGLVADDQNGLRDEEDRQRYHVHQYPQEVEVSTYEGERNGSLQDYQEGDTNSEWDEDGYVDPGIDPDYAAAYEAIHATEEYGFEAPGQDELYDTDDEDPPTCGVDNKDYYEEYRGRYAQDEAEAGYGEEEDEDDEDDEDEDEESEEDGTGLLFEPQPSPGPGATQDDAIELSD